MGDGGERIGVGLLLEGTPYRLVRALGRGASSVVYRGEHTDLRTPVVVKVMTATVDAAPELADRMRLEAQALARLAHPNLVSVIDSGIADGRMFFVMDDDGGIPLTDALGASGRMTERDAVTATTEVLEGLAFIHDNGLVHRDIHPNNLLVCTRPDGGRTVRILDLGLVKVLGGHDKHRLSPLANPTAEGTSLGTPRYMSPEQARGGAVDGRSDLYALGCVLYRLLVGQDPFAHHTTTGQLLAAQLGEAITPPSQIAPDAHIGSAVEDVVMTALAKRADERFQSARAMQTALHAALAQSGPTEQLAEPTVAGDRASYSRTQSLDEHAPPDAHAVGAPPFGRVPSNAPSLGARPLGGEPAAAATLALDAASEESLDGATQPIERAHQAAVEPRPRAHGRATSSTKATVGVFTAGWLAGLVLTVVSLVAAKSCGAPAAQTERGQVHGERLSTR